VKVARVIRARLVRHVCETGLNLSASSELSDPSASPLDIVRAGYDAVAERYLAGRQAFDSAPYLERLAALLEPVATVLDLGRGAGMPVARWLVDHGFTVAGIDVSERQIALARRLVPEGRFAVRDMTTIAEGEFRVHAVVAMYSVFHVPRGAHAGLFRRVRSWLFEGGLLLVTMGSSEWEGFEQDFFGSPMW
jgi:SAM-dependent methyltransferase